MDPQIKRWREEQLKDDYLYIMTDAVYFFLRENHQVVSCPLFITVGADKNGYRKILEIDLAFEESCLTYKAHFNRLKKEG